MISYITHTLSFVESAIQEKLRLLTLTYFYASFLQKHKLQLFQYNEKTDLYYFSIVQYFLNKS